jgi:hypothetical protein
LWRVKTAADANGGVCPVETLAAGRRLMSSAASVVTCSDRSPPGQIGAKHRALARRIHGRLDDYPTFAADPAVGFDSNGSERDLRIAKLRVKVSGCIRTMAGAGRFARMRSYISTTAKNHIGPLHALTMIFQGRPWQLPQTT